MLVDTFPHSYVIESSHLKEQLMSQWLPKCTADFSSMLVLLSQMFYLFCRETKHNIWKFSRKSMCRCFFSFFFFYCFFLLSDTTSKCNDEHKTTQSNCSTCGLCKHICVLSSKLQNFPRLPWIVHLNVLTFGARGTIWSPASRSSLQTCQLTLAPSGWAEGEKSPCHPILLNKWNPNLHLSEKWSLFNRETNSNAEQRNQKKVWNICGTLSFSQHSTCWHQKRVKQDEEEGAGWRGGSGMGGCKTRECEGKTEWESERWETDTMD